MVLGRLPSGSKKGPCSQRSRGICPTALSPRSSICQKDRTSPAPGTWHAMPTMASGSDGPFPRRASISARARR
ncbi:Uncharacterised protein [Mycobacteroides abscessus subsp. abscessus]|nr:Uncharacterised protein [Mycobacteroides abscessus subsp. abscessus]SKV95642.1 Uncharacterised protein [Mycobacteroides abscessus subsp. abscessus]